MELRWGGWRNEESERILEMLMAFEHGFFFFFKQSRKKRKDFMCLISKYVLVWMVVWASTANL